MGTFIFIDINTNLFICFPVNLGMNMNISVEYECECEHHRERETKVFFINLIRVVPDGTLMKTSENSCFHGAGGSKPCEVRSAEFPLN